MSKIFQIQIGDVGPGGGIVFITPSTEGNATGQYFESAPHSVKTKWGPMEKIPGASDIGIGTGATNTATAAESCSSGAIHIASNYSNNGFSDWFLPSKDELNEMYLNKEFLDSFSIGLYWSSSETDASFAWNQSFGDGGQYFSLKSYSGYARLVRAFS